MTEAGEARGLVAEVLGLALGEVSETAGADDLDAWDSLAHLRLVLRLEERLGRQLEVDEILEATSVPKVAALLAG